ncbi:MAG: hypothetical protein OEU78_01345 [Gammaproteobacteria bacterium]|nr:hypothetical protein [Gammaproteobacteria bacterium]
MLIEKKARARPLRANLVTFMLLVLLSVIGVGITDYSPADAHRYWIFMIFVCAITSIFAGISQSRGKQNRRSLSWVSVQLLHWSACIAAVLIVYSLVHTGRINNADAGLIMLLLLALTVFLNGAQVGPYFYLLGGFLGLMTVFMAYIEQYIWFILIAAVIFMIVAIYWDRLVAGQARSSE